MKDTASNLENKSATKAEAKRRKFRRWLQSLTTEGATGVSPAVGAALAKEQTYTVSKTWYETTGVTQEVRSARATIPWQHLPPVC